MVLLLQSREKYDEEGIKMIEASAEKEELCGMLVLGGMYEYGLYGKVKNVRRARDLYQKVMKLDIEEGAPRLRILEAGVTFVLSYNKVLTQALVNRIAHSSLLVPSLDLSRPNIMKNVEHGKVHELA